MTKGYLIDYGGTLDTRGEHWSEVIWRAYQKHNVPVTWEQYCEAYVATERRLGQGDIILPDDTFRQTLGKKLQLQLEFLVSTPALKESIHEKGRSLTETLCEETKQVTAESRQMLQRLKDKHHCPMVLVSNFYGNIRTVLREFRLDAFFADIVESAEVGIRKPDPRIWQIAMERLQAHSPTLLHPEDITVIGDSEEKDLLPARQLGCNTIHAKEIHNSKFIIQN